MRKRTAILKGLEPWFILLLNETFKYWEYDPHAKDWAEKGIRGIFNNS